VDGGCGLEQLRGGNIELQQANDCMDAGVAEPSGIRLRLPT
jgi:hypothetical protein